MLTISESCIRCGACMDACPSRAIAVTKEDGPVLVSSDCIECGHCEAICPVYALENSVLLHEQDIRLEKYPVLDAQTAELFLRSRRSNRTWQDKLVPREQTDKLLEIGRYAQTGSNMQGVTYLVVESPDTMNKLLDLCFAFFERAAQTDADAKFVYERVKENPKKRLFRDAPQCIISLTEKATPKTLRNGQFSLTYIELFAPSMGLATCWAGYLERYLREDEPAMRDLLGIPEELVVTNALLYGYPVHKYYKLANRNPKTVLWR